MSVSSSHEADLNSIAPPGWKKDVTASDNKTSVGSKIEIVGDRGALEEAEKSCEKIQSVAFLCISSDSLLEPKKSILPSLSVTKIIENATTVINIVDMSQTLATPAIGLLGASDVSGIAGIALGIIVEAGNTTVAAGNVALHSRWVKEIDPKTSYPKVNKQELKDGFWELLSSSNIKIASASGKGVSITDSGQGQEEFDAELEGLVQDKEEREDQSWEDYKTHLGTGGISVDSSIRNKEQFDKKLENPSFKKEIFKQYLTKFESVEKANIHLAAHERKFNERVDSKKIDIGNLINEHTGDFTGLQDKLLSYLTNKPLSAQTPQQREDLLAQVKIPSASADFGAFVDAFVKSINEDAEGVNSEEKVRETSTPTLETLIKESVHQEEAGVSVDRSMQTTVTKIHKLHRKFLVFDLAKSAVNLATQVVVGVARIALKIAGLAGGVSAPVGFALSIPLMLIPISVKIVGEGIRFALFRRYRSNFNNAQLSGTSVNLAINKVKLKFRQFGAQRAKDNFDQLDARSSGLDRELKIREGQIRRPAHLSPSEKKLSQLSNAVLQKKADTVGIKREKSQLKLSKQEKMLNQTEQRVDSLKKHLVDAGWKDVESFLGVGSQSESSVNKEWETLDSIANQTPTNKDLADYEEKDVEGVAEEVFEETASEKNVSLDYIERMGSGLYGLFKEGKLAPSTESFIQRQMGIDLATICEKNPGKEEEAIIHQIKRFYTRSEKEMLSFIRDQRKAGF